MPETVEIDREPVGVEAGGHVEFEAGCHGFARRGHMSFREDYHAG